VQIQILLLLRELQRELGLSIIFVTHDIGAAVEVADRIAVMYAGRIVEQGPAAQLLAQPRHPYTMSLLQSRSHGAMQKGQRLQTIPGAPPDLANLPPGCAFAERCPMRDRLPHPAAAEQTGCAACGTLSACAGTAAGCGLIHDRAAFPPTPT
jgi:oligopeptide/dipeptide ABC transporter ATP-binding protein